LGHKHSPPGDGVVMLARALTKMTSAVYLRADDTEVNVVLTLVPRLIVTATMAMAMPAAMRLYSIAVAPDSSLTKALSFPAILGSVADSREASVKVRTGI
jgi:hypothetical protein